MSGKYDDVPIGDRMAAGGMRDEDAETYAALVARAETAEAARDRIVASIVEAPPAQMSYAGRLVPINPDGMREVVDDATRLRLERDNSRSELHAARTINSALSRAIEKAKGHAGQIDEQILNDIVAVKAERDLLALVLRTIIKDDPDWLEVPEVAAAYEAIQ